MAIASEEWPRSEQQGNMCTACTVAGDVLTDYRRDGVPLTRARRRNLTALHKKCRGKASCFCQHRLPEVAA